MKFSVLSKEGKKKGIDLLGTGDCLHHKWKNKISNLNEVNESIYELDGMHFILTTEVETKDRVHHLLIFPSISKAEEFYERTKAFSKNIDVNGRPIISVSGEEMALIARECETLFGPAHAFTPYTGLYGHHDSLTSAYGNLSDDILFLELGLSADSSYADKISELHDLTYLSNSDAHSPFPHRLAREFNVIDVDDISFGSLKNLFEGKSGKLVKNVGLPPLEGKYNESACNRCYTHYSLEECTSRNWKCDCGGTIIKGVKDRVKELADSYGENTNSPQYLALIPLQEIIAKAIGHSSPNTKKVQKIWSDFVKSIDDEIEVLCNAPLSHIKKIAGAELAQLISDFREGSIHIKPGGGGKYGEIDVEEGETKEDSQKSLSDF